MGASWISEGKTNLVFREWPGDTAGNAAQLVELLNAQLDPASGDGHFLSAASAVDCGLPEKTTLVFEVLDLRRRDEHSQSIEQALCDLLVGRAVIDEPKNEIVRLLMVSDTLSLDEWEVERPGEKISIKKDVELLARALRTVDAAHYVQILLDGDRDPESGEMVDAKSSAAFAQSAILGLARKHEGPRIKRLGEIIETRSKEVRALLIAARDYPGFSELGLAGKADDFDAVLNEINLVSQFGKRRDDIITARLDPLRAKDPRVSMESYSVRARRSELLASIVANGGEPERNTREIGDKLTSLELNLKRYEFLRDLGRLLGSRSVQMLEGFYEEFEKAWYFPGGEARVLIIDDRLYKLLVKGEDTADLQIAGLRRIFAMIGWENQVHIAPPTIIPRSDFACGEAEDGPDEAGIGMRSLNGPARRKAIPLEDFAVILLDLESDERYVGALAIPRLTNHLRKFAELAPPMEKAGRKRWIAPIIVMTGTESAGTVQQSFHLGAAGYVSKTRPYQLPFKLLRALYGHSAHHRSDTPTASHFEALNALQPDVAAKLRQTKMPSAIHGGQNIAADSPVFIDKREEVWIRSLPKADLHCHLGTCIAYPAIETMAHNTVGYLLQLEDDRPLGGEAASKKRVPIASTSFNRVFDRVANAVVLGEWLHAQAIRYGLEGAEPLRCLAVGAQVFGEGKPLEMKSFGLGDEIIRRLHGTNDRVETFEIAAMLAATCGSAEDTAAMVPGSYIRQLYSWFKRTRGAKSDDKPVFDPARAFHHVGKTTLVQLWRTVSRWRGTFTRDAARLGLAPPFGSKTHGWKELAEHFEWRVKASQDATSGARARAIEVLYKGTGKGPDLSIVKESLKGLGFEHLAERLEAPSLHPDTSHAALSLREYVAIPERRVVDSGNGQSGLQRYLLGADLLGSAYLQYPDNLLIAGYALTLDNARDNVIYAEVRCETTGYARAGMNAQDATDMLCLSFDLASLFLQLQTGDQASLPLVRTNVLLAAKRHKSPAAATEAIALMEAYLQRRPGSAKERFSRSEFEMLFPSWWRPSEVVGFDISGDESKESEWLHALLTPLTRQSSPITIHAGEAASAASIWSAVYDLNATRIGHGLRLAEDSALLNYCVREGICMEMCPNSNSFTNGFDGIEPLESPRHHYPLRQYMQQGLEVCLATDNRYLHGEGRQTLTSEYLTAARLSGGLTRWEILQIVKAGFKNAFLDKDEVRSLVTEAEDRIYQIVARGWV